MELYSHPCRTQPSRGIEQAKRIGEAFRDHGIAVGKVLTSPYCRCIDTGKLAFGQATSVQYLKPPGVVSEDQAKLNQERVVQEILKTPRPLEFGDDYSRSQYR